MKPYKIFIKLYGVRIKTVLGGSEEVVSRVISTLIRVISNWHCSSLSNKPKLLDP